MEIYNNERPHQALNMKYAGELHTPSPRQYHKPDPLEYPFHDRTICVTRCGRLCFDKRKFSLSRVFALQDVGLREVADLGFFDEEEGRVEPAVNPFIPKVLPMCSV